MTMDIFDELYMAEKYDELQMKIENGLEIPSEEDYSWNDSLRTAYVSKDFNLMYFLWQNQLGVPSNEGIKKVFKAFENGETPPHLKDILKKKKTLIKESIKQHFDSSNFEVDKLILKESSLTIEEEEDDGFLVELELVFQTFMYKKQVTDTDMLFSGHVNSRELDLILSKGWQIPEDRDGWDSSIYIESTHNMAILSFLKIDVDSNSINIDIRFDFESNKTGLGNQNLKKEFITTLDIES